MDENRRNDDALFEALNKAKKRKRRRRVVTALVVVGVIAASLLLAVSHLRKRVEASMAVEGDEVLTYRAVYGNISTRVSGSGTIEDLDTETVTVPDGVEIDEVVVKSNTRLKQGDVIATLDLMTVLNTMAAVLRRGRDNRQTEETLFGAEDGRGRVYGRKRSARADLTRREDGG